MSLDYADVAAGVLDALDELGMDVTLRRVATGAYDASQGSAGTNDVDTTRRAAVLPFGSGQTQVRGALIQANDRRCIMDAGGAAPTADDEVAVSGTVYSVMSVAEIAPAGVAVAYDMHLRAS